MDAQNGSGGRFGRVPDQPTRFGGAEPSSPCGGLDSIKLPANSGEHELIQPSPCS